MPGVGDAQRIQLGHELAGNGLHGDKQSAVKRRIHYEKSNRNHQINAAVLIGDTAVFFRDEIFDVLRYLIHKDAPQMSLSWFDRQSIYKEIAQANPENTQVTKNYEIPLILEARRRKRKCPGCFLTSS